MINNLIENKGKKGSDEVVVINVCSYKRPKLFTAFYSKLIINLLTTKLTMEKGLGLL